MADENSDDSHFKDAYSLETPEQTKAHYKSWAASYDQEVGEHGGYAQPRRVAQMFSRYLDDSAGLVRDAGCEFGGEAGAGEVAGDVGDALADAWRNARFQRLTNGSIEVIGLVPGPVWVPEVELGDGRRVDAIQAQASTEPGPAVGLRVTQAPR